MHITLESVAYTSRTEFVFRNVSNRRFESLHGEQACQWTFASIRDIAWIFVLIRDIACQMEMLREFSTVTPNPKGLRFDVQT